MKEQHTSQLSALGATVSELKTSLSKSASCLEVAEGKLEGLLENPTPSSSKLREKVFVSVLREKKNLQKMGLYIPITNVVVHKLLFLFHKLKMCHQQPLQGL